MASFAHGKRFTATGALVASNKGAIVWAVTIETDGTNAGTVTIKGGGSGGTIRWQGLCAGADRSRHFEFPRGLYVEAEAHVTLAGTGAACSILHEPVTP